MKILTINQLKIMLWIALLACTQSAVVYGQAEESLAGSNFEIDTDANITRDNDAPSIDWLNVDYDGTADMTSGSGDDAFGQGSKEDSETPSVVSGSIPPNKSDLRTFGIYFEDTGPQNRFLHLFWTRVQDPSGTTNMDFEFNQGSVVSGNGVTPVRTDGDILFQYDLENGGTSPQLFLSFWLDDLPGNNAAECEASNSLPCWSSKIPLDVYATGSINTSPIADVSGEFGDLDPRTFGEASIDFGELFGAVNNGSCLSFGSAHLKSRSSDSFNSSLKDFIEPIGVRVSNCATITITKQDDASVPLAGIEFELYEDNAPFDGTYNGSGEDGTIVLDSCTTGANGVCLLKDVFPGHYWVIETAGTIPAGHTGSEPVHVEITGPGEDEPITVTNTRLPASVQITKQDDAGNALNGATFTLYTDNIPTDSFGAEDVFKSACTTSGTGADAGKCTISGILPAGDYCLDETVVPANHTKDSSFPQCFSLTLSESKTVSSVNPRQPAKVMVIKKDDAGSALNGATFTLYSDVDGSGTLNTGDTVKDACTTSGTGASAGKCMIDNILPPGKYCLDETVVPAGFSQDVQFPTCFTLILGQTKTVNPVNPRNQGAIKITKTRKHKAATNPAADPHIGVTFTITDSDGTVIGSGATEDENGQYKDVCIENVLFSTFAPGDGLYVVTETVPTGYAAVSPQTVEVNQVGSCGNNEETVSFSNTPLTDFTVSVNSQIDGGTSTTITCDNGNGGKTIPATPDDNGDGSHTVTGLEPGTYSCTLVIDP